MCRATRATGPKWTDGDGSQQPEPHQNDASGCDQRQATLYEVTGSTPIVDLTAHG